MLQPATRTPYECELPYQPLWPLAATLIGREPGVVLLDSGGEPGPSARWSLLAWRPRQVLAWPQGAPGALAALRGLLRRRAPAPTGGGALPFHGGWLGWLSYDLGRQIERLPSLATPDRRIPDFVLGEYDLALLEDRGSRRLFAVGTAADGREEAGFEARIEAVLRRPAAEALACLGKPGATSPPARCGRGGTTSPRSNGSCATSRPATSTRQTSRTASTRATPAPAPLSTPVCGAPAPLPSAPTSASPARPSCFP